MNPSLCCPPRRRLSVQVQSKALPRSAELANCGPDQIHKAEQEHGNAVAREFAEEQKKALLSATDDAPLGAPAFPPPCRTKSHIVTGDPAGNSNKVFQLLHPLPLLAIHCGAHPAHLAPLPDSTYPHALSFRLGLRNGTVWVGMRLSQGTLSGLGLDPSSPTTDD
jgi:hypothetical protein